MPNSPYIQPVANLNWVNHHKTARGAVRAHWDMLNSPGQYATDRIRESALRMQGLLKEAVDAKVRVRAYGAKWSFSDLPLAVDGWMIKTNKLNILRFPHISNMDLACRENVDELILAQCGATIGSINAVLETPERRQSLRTSGASNGQTIAGAIGTGVHGSAVNVGGLESQVAGLQIVLADRIVWLEDPAKPMFNEEYVERMGAELIRDDQLFRAALVSLGAMGVVHAVLLRTTGRYGLVSSTVHVPFDRTAAAMNSLVFDPAMGLPHPDQTLYFFQVIMDPAATNMCYVTVRHKVTYPEAKKPEYDKPDLFTRLATDVPGLIGEFINAFPIIRNDVVSLLLNLLVREKTGDLRNPRTHGETYGATNGREDLQSCGFGIPIAQVTNALRIAEAAFNRDTGSDNAAVVFTFRYAQRSPATLGFTAFGPTCVFDVDGIASDEARELIAEIARRFDEAGMPYTQHWGKTNDLTKARVRRVYGTAVDRWNLARQALIPDAQERWCYSTDYLDGLGLNETLDLSQQEV